MSIRATGPSSSRSNNLPESRPYVYRGKQPFTAEDLATSKRRSVPQAERWQPGQSIAHGTARGYQQHGKTEGWPVECQPCREAHNAVTRASKAARKAKRRAA